jgi:hypothetical protein
MGHSPKLGDGSTLPLEMRGKDARLENPVMTKEQADAALKSIIDIESGPPPWETVKGKDASNARQFVECPDEWVLRWINPKLLDLVGWRGWQHVRAQDPRVTVKVKSMISPENMVRRGGATGDILAYMPKHWYEQRKQEKIEKVARQTAAAVEKMRSLKDDFRGGKYGPNVTLESAKHPTHTMGDFSGERD